MLYQTLRTAAQLTRTVLLIPLNMSLARVLDCPGDVWLTTSVPCFGNSHVAILVVTCLLLLAVDVVLLLGKLRFSCCHASVRVNSTSLCSLFIFDLRG